MRAASSCLAILLSLPASVDSNIGTLGKLTQELVERGLTPAHVSIEYSLTDDCYLTGLRVLEYSHPDMLVPKVVDTVVEVMIGPYSDTATSGELIQFSTNTESPPEKLSMTTRMISWSTTDGHSYVVCRFYADGQLESTRLVDGHGMQYDGKIEDRIIDQPLSEMGPNTIKASFVSE